MASKRRPTPQMAAVPEKWTWQMAEEALSKNIGNRIIRQSVVDEYARMMAESLWGGSNALSSYRGAPAPLIFDWDGNIVDGQHRLLGQVKSKTTQYWYVLRDVPPDTKDYVDTGTPRSAADILKFAGYGNYTVLQGVARWAWLLDRGQASTGSVKVGIEEIKHMVDMHPDLVHSGEIGASASRANLWASNIGPTPMGAAHWWIAQYNDHIEADMFLDRFINLNREPDGSAITALWSRLSTAKRERQHVQLRVRLAMIVRAWNLDVEGTFVRTFQTRSKSGEFPVPDPLKREVSQEQHIGPTIETSEGDAETA